MTEHSAAYNNEDVFKGIVRSLLKGNTAHLQKTHERILDHVDFSKTELVTAWYFLIVRDVSKQFGVEFAFDEARRAFNKSQTGSEFEGATATALLHLAKDLAQTRPQKANEGVGSVIRASRKREDDGVLHNRAREVSAVISGRDSTTPLSQSLSLG